MRFLRVCMIALLLPAVAAAQKIKEQPNYDYREGDILFYGGVGAQSDAIREATDSTFTHCGVLFQHEGKWWVFEAVQPVKSSPLEAFIKRAKPGTLKAYRLKENLDPEAAVKVRAWIKEQVGKPYDLKFLWEDEKLYCSELVWKLYNQAGVQLCDPKTFGDYNLNAPTVKKIIQHRYGGVEKLPMKEVVVAPSDIASSGLLIEVPRFTKARKR